MSRNQTTPPPILRDKDYSAPSLFVPENLLREARRQMAIPAGQVPRICVLDPDGDIVDSLQGRDETERNVHWACYHTELNNFRIGDLDLGIIGYTVGAPFAVLVAEQLFASGCELLINVTSSGVILPDREPPFFVLIEKALRDEGASYHYLPPSDFADADPALLACLDNGLSHLKTTVLRGATWTTDAPYRETETAIEQARGMGILAVEMEAAALYAFARARGKAVVCFAHVTNRMAQVEGDFEKGEASGSRDALEVIAATATAWLASEINDG